MKNLNTEHAMIIYGVNVYDYHFGYLFKISLFNMNYLEDLWTGGVFSQCRYG